MGKLDVASTVAKKAMNAVPDEEKKELLLDELKQIETDRSFKKIKKKWDALDDDKKLKYYENGEIISVKGSVKWTTKGGLSFALFPFNLLSKDVRNEAFAPAMRLCVNVGLLDAPKGLSNQELSDNIKRDADSLSRNLKIFSAIGSVIPVLKIASKIANIVIPYADWYKKNGVPLIQERVKEKQTANTTNELVDALSIPEENKADENIIENKAA